jgi:hypothetical protein
MKRNTIQNEEAAVKLMAGVLVDRLMLDREDENEVAAVEEWMRAHTEARSCFTELSDPKKLLTRLRRYKHCTHDEKNAFQTLIHRVTEPTT